MDLYRELYYSIENKFDDWETISPYLLKHNRVGIMIWSGGLVTRLQSYDCKHHFHLSLFQRWSLYFLIKRKMNERTLVVLKNERDR